MSVTYLTVSAQEKDMAIALGAMQDPASGRLFVPRDLPVIRFQAWLPRPGVGTALAPREQPGMSLSALLTHCGAVIKSAFPEPVWVRIEISQMKSSSGHLYMGAIERGETDGRELAKTTAMIWSSNVTKLVSKFTAGTGMELAPGIQVLVQVKPEFRAQYGMGLQIIDIDPSYTLGNLDARLKRIRTALEESGDADKNKRLPTPDDFFHVGVISPAGAAGLDDFQAGANLLAATGLCKFTYFEAVFQGDRAKESIKQAMVEAHHVYEARSLDALAIIRGGGAAADLHWLDEYLIARMVCRFHCPVFTGIGHERDKSILDEYANRAFGTPSKVIAHIKETIARKAAQGYEDWTFISQAAGARLSASDGKIDLCKAEIDTGIDRKLARAESNADKAYANIKSAAAASLQDAQAKADFFNGAITMAARAALELAQENVEHRMDSIRDRAAAALNAAAVNIDNSFSSITLAARRSIDGVDEHLDGQLQSILGSAANAVHATENEVDRDFADVRYHARKTIHEAENTAKDLMSGILAHGVEPTLKRGFAIVRNAQGPVSTKAAAASSTGLEVVFRDGTMKIMKGE
jgi:exodeoxyribonuclease VII large subunit